MKWWEWKFWRIAKGPRMPAFDVLVRDCDGEWQGIGLGLYVLVSRRTAGGAS